MKKLRMIVTSVIILAIVSSAFAFKATKKIGRYCYSTVFNGACEASPPNQKRVAEGTLGSTKKYYVVNWDGNGDGCTTGAGCTEPAGFLNAGD